MSIADMAQTPVISCNFCTLANSSYNFGTSKLLYFGFLVTRSVSSVWQQECPMAKRWFIIDSIMLNVIVCGGRDITFKFLITSLSQGDGTRFFKHILQNICPIINASV